MSAIRALIAVLAAAALVQDAGAAQIRVLCPNALRAPMLDIARSFVRLKGHNIEFVFAGVVAIHKRAASGERVDVAIGTVTGVDALVRLGSGMNDGSAKVARTVLALVLPRHRPRPDVGSASALAQVLRDARSLVVPSRVAGAPGGVQVATLLDALGIATELGGKMRGLANSREVISRVASGAAEVGIIPMSDGIGKSEVATVGPLSHPLSVGVDYAAVVLRRSAVAEAARTFVAYLGAPESKAAMRAAGFGAAD